MMAELGVCILLAALAGFAVQRGGVCVVAAARDGVLHKQWGGFVAFAECSIWALFFYALIDVLGLRGLGTYPVRASVAGALLGGALFGCGALINGACAYGTMGRLAAGEVSFLLMFVGFVLGAKLGHETLVGRFHQETMRFAVSGPALAWLGAMLLAFVLMQAWSARRGAPSLRQGLAVLAGKAWPSSLTMAVIAFASVGLIAILTHWTYTGLLTDFATGHAPSGALRAALAAVFLGGAIVGAVSAGRFRWRGASWGDVAARVLGGGLMGVGATLIPGGNDGLIVMGLPLLLAGPMLAYASMTAIVLLGFAIDRARRRGFASMA